MLVHRNAHELSELKKTTIPLMTAVAISNIMYTSLHSFFPIYIETHFKTLSSIHFSTIIAIFEVANLVTSLVLGLYMSQVRRKDLIVWSNILLLFSTLAFVSLPYLTDETQSQEIKAESYSRGYWFFGLCIIFRVAQGMAGASIQICGYSYATNEMSIEKDLYIGYVEMALGIGDMIGPAMSGVFYGLFGFTGTFIIFSAMILFGTIFSIIWIPSSLNNLSSDLVEEDLLKEKLINDTEIKENGSFRSSNASQRFTDLTYKIIFSNTQCLMLLISALFAVIFTLYIEPLLALVLYN